MSAVEVSPEIAKQILTNAKSKGLSVEIYLKEIIKEKEDERLSVMREAVNDKLFMEGLADTVEDFKHTDPE